MKNKNRLRELSDSIKCNNIHIIGVPEEEEREREKIIWQNNAENFPDLGKKTYPDLGDTEEPPKSTKANRHRDIL